MNNYVASLFMWIDWSSDDLYVWVCLNNPHNMLALSARKELVRRGYILF